MNKYELPETHKECLLTLMSHIHNLFLKHSIKYFIDGGTLLGAEREKDIIPHDDDIDIGVLNKDWYKLPNILKELADAKYKIHYQIEDYLIKVFVPNMWMKEKETGRIIGTPTLDIFKWKKSNGKIELESTIHRRAFKNCYYGVQEMFPLKIYQFNNLYLWGANNGKPYLFRYYGNDCLTIKKRYIRDEKNALLKIGEEIISS
jgi:phosphorylcholine metabolism protein LicD